MSRAPRPNLEGWFAASMDLLPPGIAWSRSPSSNLGKLMSVLAEERLARHERKIVLLDVESVPTRAVELLTEWERHLGLPDPCRAAPGTLNERWLEVADRYFADHPPTVENMAAWAGQAGWNISVREQRDFVAGVSQAGDAIAESDFVWVVTVLGQAIERFQAGRNASGDVLWTFPDIATLECVIRRAAPAHTRVHFVVP